MQDLYRQGVLDPSFALKKGEQVKQDICRWQDRDHVRGTMGGISCRRQQEHRFRMRTGKPFRSFPPMIIPPKVPLKFTTSSFFAVRTGYEHPEAIVKLFNLHLEKNWGETAEYEVLL